MPRCLASRQRCVLRASAFASQVGLNYCGPERGVLGEAQYVDTGVYMSENSGTGISDEKGLF